MTRTPTPSSSMPPSAHAAEQPAEIGRQRPHRPTLPSPSPRRSTRALPCLQPPEPAAPVFPVAPGKRGGTRICNACRSRAARCRARRSSRVLRSTPEHACAVALCDARADGCRAAAGRRSRRPRNRKISTFRTSPTSSRETMPTPSPPATPPRSMSRPWRQSSKIRLDHEL